MVLLRFPSLNREAVLRLHASLEIDGPLKQFVKLKSAHFEDGVYTAAVDLRVEERQQVSLKEMVHATRDVPDALFDLLGIFPRDTTEEKAERARIAANVATIARHVAEARVRHDSPDLEKIFRLCNALFEDLNR